MRERFERMIAYAANEEQCRSAMLQAYFGESDPEPCGVCDLCLARRRAAKQQEHHPTPDRSSAADPLDERLLRLLAAGPCDPRTLAADAALPPERIAESLRRLLDEGKIITGDDGNLRIIP